MPHTNMEFLNDLELCFFLLLQHLLPLAASRVFHNGGVLGLTTVDMQNWPEVSLTLWVPSIRDPSCLFTSAEPWCSILLCCSSRQVIKPCCWLSPQRTETRSTWCGWGLRTSKSLLTCCFAWPGIPHACGGCLPNQEHPAWRKWCCLYDPDSGGWP